MIGAFGKGFIIGISIAAPIGALGILVIKRTLSLGRFCGIATGLGIATADLIYAGIAAFGITVLMDFLVEQQFWIKIFGAAFLLYLAIKTFISPIPHADAQGTDNSAKAILVSYASVLALTLADPMTIIAFAAIFSSFCLGQQDIGTSLLMVTGVFTGVSLWFTILTEVVYYFREKFTERMLKITNILSGVLLAGFALMAAASAIYQVCFIA